MPPREQALLYRPPVSWRVYRRLGNSKIFLGSVEASSQKAAIERAIRTFQISDRLHQEHLVAEARDRAMIG